MIRKRTWILLAGLQLLFSQTGMASPANPNPVKMKQPDGKEVLVRIQGDEQVKWMESPDGYSLLYGNEKQIVYAVTDEKGDMVPSDILFEANGLRSSPGLKKGLRYSRSQIETFREINTVLKSLAAGPELRATTGEAKAICALIGFPDKPFAHTADEFSQLMNQLGYSANGAKGSVRDFYRENSYGQLDLIVTVVGPYTASKEWKYYGENHATSQHDKNPGELAREAAGFAFTDPQVNLADYDNDHDGFIDTFHFLYAGYGEEAGGSADCIWAHKSGITPALTFGNKKLNTYSCSPELRGNAGNNISNIGVICHELCHVFGAPDYYDTDQTGDDFQGTGSWDLMAEGSWNENGVSPAHINMYQKIVFGWVVPTALTSEQEISGMPNAAENPVAYTVQTTMPGEYFILENRQKVQFDSGLAGHGLLIYRVSSLASGNQVNNNIHPQQVYPVCASSVVAIPNSNPASYGNIESPGCPFPGTSGNTIFTDYSIPSAKSWNGNNTAKPLTDIREENGLIAFSFMKSNAAMTHFQTEVNGRNVTLSWNLPDGILPDGYTIYRNDETIITLNDGAARSYTQYGVAPGNYDYCIAPVYGIAESAKRCAAAVVTGSATICPAITHLSAGEKGDVIDLNWESEYQNIWLSQSGAFGGQFVGYNLNNYTIATRFTTDVLRYQYGLSLTKVRVAVLDLNCQYTIKVWNPASGNMPTSPALTQAFTPTVTGVYEVELQTPIPILGGGKELWIGISFQQTTPAAIVARDDGPRKTSINYLYYNNSWTATSAQDGFNFYLEGYFEDRNLRPGTTTPGFKGYRIYRNNQYLETVFEPYFRDTQVPEGNYIYCISAGYDTAESEQVCVTARATVPPNPCPGVEQLSGSVARQTATLSWNEPQDRGGEAGYAGNKPLSSIGLTRDGSFDIAIRFPVSDVAARNGTVLNKVKFIPGDASTAYSIRIWQGGDAMSPGRLILDQPVSGLRLERWNEIELEHPIYPDIYEDLWIGIHCNALQGQSPAVLDSNPAVKGKGNLIYLNGKWQLLNDLDPSFDSNWCISGVFESLYSLHAYGVYRNGASLGSTTTTVFGQSDLENGEYLYEVSAIYVRSNQWYESDKEPVRISVNYTGTHPVQPEEAVKIYPNPVPSGGALVIDLGSGRTGEAIVYRLSGEVVKRIPLHSSSTSWDIRWSPGTYLIRIRLDTGKTSVVKLLVN